MDGMDRRRQAKMDYKQMVPPKGVYQIKNTINGRIFIGHSMNLEGNKNSYPTKLEFDSHYHQQLREDLKEHGIDAFVFEVLETIDTEEIPQPGWKDAVIKLEDKWLDTLQPYGDKGYNKPKKRR